METKSADRIVVTPIAPCFGAQEVRIPVLDKKRRQGERRGGAAPVPGLGGKAAGTLGLGESAAGGLGAGGMSGVEVAASGTAPVGVSLGGARLVRAPRNFVSQNGRSSPSQ